MGVLRMQADRTIRTADVTWVTRRGDLNLGSIQRAVKGAVCRSPDPDGRGPWREEATR